MTIPPASTISNVRRIVFRALGYQGGGKTAALQKIRAC
jgi:hypothetical protein